MQVLIEGMPGPVAFTAQLVSVPKCGCPACRSGLDIEQLLEMSSSSWLINRLQIVGDVVVWDDRKEDEV